MRILIVDDSQDILDLLYNLLDSFGHEVDCARDGFAALDQLARHQYPVMITDLKMPLMDGMQLLKHSKAQYPATEVIMITGYSKSFTYVDVIKNGAVDFIVKPFMADELAAKLNRVIREQEVRQALKEERQRLEKEVAKRTAALVQSNDALRKEISERKQLEASLRESMATGVALMEAPTDAILFIDPQGIILAVNQISVQDMGQSAPELCGRSLWELLPKQIVAARREMVAKVIASGHHVVGEEELAGRWSDLVIYPIFNDQGQPGKIAIIARDVTARKESEKILQEKQTQLIHAGRLTALGEMATGMAHEINQPLTVIRLIADNLKSYFKKNHPAAKELESVEDMIAQVLRAATIIRNMRSFARHSNGSHRAVCLPALVENSLSFFREQFRLSEIALSFSAPSDLPLLHTDGQKFEQIVVNFLTNAKHAVDNKAKAIRAATPAPVAAEPGLSAYKKAIALSLAPVGQDSLVFTVQDNGLGMSSEVRSRCLEPGHRHRH